MHLDVELALGRNLVEATTTCVALHIDDAEAITSALANALEATQQTWVDFRLQLFGLSLQLLFLVLRLLHDLVELALLLVESHLAVLDDLLVHLHVALLLLHLDHGFANLLVAKFDFQRLILDFLGQRVVFAVVLHLVQLVLIAVYACLSLVDLGLLLENGGLEILDVGLDFLNTNGQSGNLVFQVLHLERQFATQGLLVVDSRKCGLKLVKGLQLLFH